MKILIKIKINQILNFLFKLLIWLVKLLYIQIPLSTNPENVQITLHIKNMKIRIIARQKISVS